MCEPSPGVRAYGLATPGWVAEAAPSFLGCGPRLPVGNAFRILQATPTKIHVVHKSLKYNERGFDDRTSPSANYRR
jgi:hypothetical protein